MSRIWRRVSLLPGVRNECTIVARLTYPRSLSVTAYRYDSAKENTDDESINGKGPTSTKQAQPAGDAAGSLMSTLTGLKVEKNLGSKVGRSPRLRSAAADFRALLGQKQAKKEDGASTDTKSPDDVKKMVVERVKAVAEIFPEKEVVESDLLRQLRKHDEATAAGQQGDLEAVSSILSGIKIQKQTARQRQEDLPDSQDGRAMGGSFGSGFQVREERGDWGNVERDGKPREAFKRQHKTLFERHRLNIFKPDAMKTSEAEELAVAESAVPSLWDKEEASQLRKLSYSTIISGFDEMMKWTEEGKTWCFPIDNEQGLEEEQEVPFHEHIFFDHLLEDLPQIESIQAFMELVCLGLSRNPYLTVQQKHDHINWFKAYFKEREATIKEALEAEREADARETAM